MYKELCFQLRFDMIICTEQQVGGRVSRGRQCSSVLLSKNCSFDHELPTKSKAAKAMKR